MLTPMGQRIWRGPLADCQAMLRAISARPYKFTLGHAGGFSPCRELDPWSFCYFDRGNQFAGFILRTGSDDDVVVTVSNDLRSPALDRLAS